MDAQTLLLARRARELNFTDLEIMGLRRFAKVAREVGATPQDLQRNLGATTRQCRSALANPTLAPRDYAKQNVCNELLTPTVPSGASRTLAGVFSRELRQDAKVRQMQNVRNSRQDIFAKMNEDALKKERERLLKKANADKLKEDLGTAFNSLLSMDVMPAFNLTIKHASQLLDGVIGSMANLSAEQRVQGAAAMGAAIWQVISARGTRESLDAARSSLPSWLTSESVYAFLGATATWAAKHGVHAALIGVGVYSAKKIIDAIMARMSSSPSPPEDGDKQEEDVPPPAPPPQEQEEVQPDQDTSNQTNQTTRRPMQRYDVVQGWLP